MPVSLYARLTCVRPFSVAARDARLAMFIAPCRADTIEAFSSLVNVAILVAPVGYARSAHVKYITVLSSDGAFTSCYVRLVPAERFVFHGRR